MDAGRWAPRETGRPPTRAAAPWALERKGQGRRQDAHCPENERAGPYRRHTGTASSDAAGAPAPTAAPRARRMRGRGVPHGTWHALTWANRARPARQARVTEDKDRDAAAYPPRNASSTTKPATASPSGRVAYPAALSVWPRCAHLVPPGHLANPSVTVTMQGLFQSPPSSLGIRT
jgi:hypothetical protein